MILDIMTPKSIYKSKEGKEKITSLYDKALQQLNLPYDSKMVDTRYGKTHILLIGPEKGLPVFIFQGGNTVNPVTLSWFKPILTKFRIYAPDTIGHPGLSSENRISPKDDSFGKWVVDILDYFKLKQVNMIGPSYGAGIILRTASFFPKRISKTVLLVPSGIGSGSISKMMFKIVFPMLMYRMLPNQKRLKKAVKPMVSDSIDEISLNVIGAVYRYVRLETKMPKLTTQEELHDFKAPTMIFSSENDIFFPANKVNSQAKKIIPNLIQAEILKGNNHFPSSKSLENINHRIIKFLSD